MSGYRRRRSVPMPHLSRSFISRLQGMYAYPTTVKRGLCVPSALHPPYTPLFGLSRLKCVCPFNYFLGPAVLALSAGDNGSVNINSGVNNEAVYLMTDGDSFTSHTITGMGISEVADLYYEVRTNMLTSASDYANMYDTMIQASINLEFSGSEQ